MAVIREWRQRIIGFVCDGHEEYEPWEAWDGNGGEGGKIIVVGDDAFGIRSREWYLGPGTRWARLIGIAESERGSEGDCDFLWEEVCRKWLDG